VNVAVDGLLSNFVGRAEQGTDVDVETLKIGNEEWLI
jgi:hypothetical protein